jgi:hypothetical protein
LYPPITAVLARAVRDCPSGGLIDLLETGDRSSPGRFIQ